MPSQPSGLDASSAINASKRIFDMSILRDTYPVVRRGAGPAGGVLGPVPRGRAWEPF